MELTSAKTLAFQALRDNGLMANGWSFEWDRAVRRFGCTHYSTKTITLSEPLTRLNDEDEVWNVILHEVAHAMVGGGHGHDAVWKRQHRALGGTAARTHNAATPPTRWVATCASCGGEHGRTKRPGKPQACAACCKRYAGGRFSQAYVLSFYLNPAFGRVAGASR